MKKTEFQKRLTNSLMEAILAEVLQDNSLPCIRFTSKGRTVRLQIGDGMDKVQIYINRSAEVSYMLTDFAGITCEGFTTAMAIMMTTKMS